MEIKDLKEIVFASLLASFIFSFNSWDTIFSGINSIIINFFISFFLLTSRFFIQEFYANKRAIKLEFKFHPKYGLFSLALAFFSLGYFPLVFFFYNNFIPKSSRKRMKFYNVTLIEKVKTFLIGDLIFLIFPIIDLFVYNPLIVFIGKKSILFFISSLVPFHLLDGSVIVGYSLLTYLLLLITGIILSITIYLLPTISFLGGLFILISILAIFYFYTSKVI